MVERARSVAGSHPHEPTPASRPLGGPIPSRVTRSDDHRPVDHRPVDRRFAAVVKLALGVGLAGVLLAGFAVPWLGGAGVVAERGAGLLRPVESAVVDTRLAGNTRVLAADGSLITEFYRHNRTPLTAGQMAPSVRSAVVAIEDARFFEHDGVDGRGLFRALVRNLAAGEVVQGGSTLTQQLVKQLRLQTAEDTGDRTAATEESIGRKLREAQLALAMEQQYTKDEILTRYLNTVYFGRGAYGIAAAADTWFATTADRLTLAQSAALAAIVNSPAGYDLVDRPVEAQQRRDRVLDRMAALGLAGRAEAAVARAEPLGVTPGGGPPRGCVEARIGGFACGHLLGELAGLGVDRAMLDAGGLVVTTTLDPAVQSAGDAAVRATLPETDSRAAIYTAVQPGTGAVLAMSVNRTYGIDPDDPTQTSVDLPAAAGQGAGSTYKVFTAVAALEAGFGLQHTISTPDPYVSSVYRDGPAAYDVGNAGTYPRTLDMEQALYRSSNTYFLALEDALGNVAGPVSAAQRMGLTSLAPVADAVVAENRGSFTFGAEPTSPLALTGAYATLAASGTRCQTHVLAAVTDRAGQPVLREDGTPLVPGDRCTPGAVAPGIADTLSQALRKDVEPGHPGQTARRAYIPGHQIAGKTGTSQDNYSIAFVGYTPQVAAGVMVYDPVQNQDVGGFGGGKAATIWHDAMLPVLSARPAVPFPPADPRYVAGSRTRLPAGCMGAGVDRCRALLADAGIGTQVVMVDAGTRAGTVLRLDPPAGASLPSGARVTVTVSNGSRYTPPPPPPPAPEPAPTPEPTQEPSPSPEPAPQPERPDPHAVTGARADPHPGSRADARPGSRADAAADRRAHRGTHRRTHCGTVGGPHDRAERAAGGDVRAVGERAVHGELTHRPRDACSTATWRSA